MPWLDMFKITNMKYFESENEYSAYFNVCDLDDFLAEGYFLEFIKLLKLFVTEDCIGCRTVNEEKHDLCFVCVYSLIKTYWERLLDRIDQEQVYINVLSSDFWLPAQIEALYKDKNTEFPSNRFDDAFWRQSRLADPHLKYYWMRKINAFWKNEYNGDSLSECRLNMTQ